MGGLVEDLLLLAELDRGRPLRSVRVDLQRICTDAVDDSNAVPHAHSLKLQPGPPVMVVGDDERLAQVAHNLVRNALAHTPPGTEVVVSTGVAQAMGYIKVSDNGPGIPPAVAGRVFDRFYQGDPSRSASGTGLGHCASHRRGAARDRRRGHVAAGRGQHCGQDPVGRVRRPARPGHRRHRRHRRRRRVTGAGALTAIALRCRATRHRARWPA